jgi:hypothetical protein
MAFLILIFTFLFCLSAATLTHPPIDQSDDAYLASINLIVPSDLKANDLEDFFMTHNYDNWHPIFTFLSGLKAAINKDPTEPHSLEVVLKAKNTFTLNPLVFMMVIKSLHDEEFILHVCLMLREFKKYNDYLRSVERCYSKKHLERKVKVIFNCLDRIIHDRMKMPFPTSVKRIKLMILINRKQFANLVLSILQKISFSPSSIVDLTFLGVISTETYFIVMTSYIEEIIYDSLLGAKKINPQLHKLYPEVSGELSLIKEREHPLTLLLLFHHYSCCIIDFEYPEVDVDQLEPSFLARLVLGKKNSDVSDFFRYFDNPMLLYNGANSFYHYFLNPRKEVDYINDFTKKSHNIPLIPDNRKDLQWILKAYDKIRFHLIRNWEIMTEEDYSDRKQEYFGFLSKIGEAITKDPLNPHSSEILCEMNRLYTSGPFLFMKTLNSLYDEDLILHVCLMLKNFEKYETFVESLKNCYLEGSYKILPKKKMQVIFNCFDELIRSQMKRAIKDPKEMDHVLETRKYLAHLMLSMLQRIRFSPSFKVEFSFACEKLSIKSYFIIIYSYIEGITVNSFRESKTINDQLLELNNEFSAKMPYQTGTCEKAFILLLLFQHYSYFTVKYDFADVVLHRVEPCFLARIAIASAESNMHQLFIFFNTSRLLFNGANSLYNDYLNPTQKPHYILDFANEVHSIRSIPDDRKDLQWVLEAYNKLRLQIVNNIPLQ